MEAIAISGSLRKETGKKSSKLIRTQESVPCVIYGGEKNINFFASERDFNHILFTPTVYIVNVNIDGKIHNAIIKDLQFHPVSDKLLHVDFYELSEDKPVTVEIPVKLTGSSKGVREGGKLMTDKRKVKVKGFYKNIPAEIEIDITELGVGKSIRAGDLESVDGKFKVTLAKETPIVSVRTTRAAAAAAAQEAAPKK